MKTFADVKQGDNVYFLIDTCNILQGCGNSMYSGGVGFANPNYGLILCQRIVSSDRWEWHNPRTETGHLFNLRIASPIMNGNKCLFGPHVNEYGNECDSVVSVTKEMGRKTCIQQSFGDYFLSYKGYVFTTKEELESMVREITDIVEANLKRIKDDLNNLL